MDNKAPKKVIELLIAKDVYLNVKDDNGWTPLMFACDNNASKEVIELLIAKGADVNAKDNSGWTPLMFALYYDAPEAKEVIELLIAKGADITAKDKDNKTALMYAVKRKSVELTELLISKGLDVNAKDNKGRTPLIYAADYSNPTTVDKLIKAGADVNAKDNDGWTPLMWATISGVKGYEPGIGRINQEVVRLLIEAGADVNAKDNEGMTLLDYADKYGSGFRVYELLQKRDWCGNGILSKWIRRIEEIRYELGHEKKPEPVEWSDGAVCRPFSELEYAIFMRMCFLFNILGWPFVIFTGLTADKVTQEIKEQINFTDVYNRAHICDYGEKFCDSETLTDVKLVKKFQNKDGSYTVVTKSDLDRKGSFHNKWRGIKTYSNVEPSKSDICKDLIADDNGNLKCVKGTQAELPIKTMKEQIKETKRKSELKSVTPAKIVYVKSYNTR